MIQLNLTEELARLVREAVLEYSGDKAEYIYTAASPGEYSDEDLAAWGETEKMYDGFIQYIDDSLKEVGL